MIKKFQLTSDLNQDLIESIRNAWSLDENKVFYLNSNEPSENVRNFYESLDIKNLKIYFDPEFNLVKSFNMRGVPTSILIDKEGKEFARIIGEIDFSNKFFINFLEKYI